jgi:outer membrane receptor protein involved in Fe transport
VKEDRKNFLQLACLSTSAFALMATALVPTQTWAQDADDDEEVEEVIVTGSRIKRTGFDTVQPATVVDSEFIDARGFDNIATALNELPGFSPGISNNGGQAGQNVGQNFVNAFGLGSQRTLILINGRRTVGQNTPTIVGTGVGGGLQVDLNIIPTALIDRVETIFTGGAPIYGSDAIAGTVNLIMKDDYEGMDTEVQYGISDRGDAKNYRFRSTMGGNFADGRGNVVFAVEYSNQAGLIGNDRPEYHNGVRSNCTNTGGLERASDGVVTDEVMCADGVNIWQLPDTGYILPGYGAAYMFPGWGNSLVDADGDPVMFDLDGGLIKVSATNPGDSSRGNPGIFFSQGADSQNNPYYTNIRGDTTTFRSPLERYMTMGMGHYDISDNVRFITEFLYSRSESTDERNQPSWSTEFFAPGQGALRINIADNPWVTDELRTLLAVPVAAPTDDDPDAVNIGYDPLDPTAQYFFVTRSNQDMARQINSRNFRDQEVFRYVAGFEGEFESLGRSFDWDLTYTFGQTHATTSQTTMNFERYGLAVDAVSLADDEVGAGVWVIRGGQAMQLAGPSQAGDIACRSTVNPPEDLLQGGRASAGNRNDIDACIPINIMGVNQGADEAVNYLFQNQIALTELQQSVVEGSVATELWEMEAGAVGFAAGFAHRRENGRFDSGQGAILGIDNAAPATNTAGSFQTSEIYGELFIPIAANGAGFMSGVFSNWSVEGAARYVDNNRAGGDTTWTVGSRATLNMFGDAFTFRGNYTEAIRAPSLSELFQPLAQSFFFASDPCDMRFIDQGPAPATRRANCEAEVAAAMAAGELPTDFDLAVHQSVIVNASQPGLTGGNPNLLNESSEAWSLGLVFQPSEWIPGLTISADWTDITINNAMVTPSATQLSRACYDNTAYPDVPLGAGSACDTFSRTVGTGTGYGPDTVNNLPFDLIAPITTVVNAAVREFAGATVNATYEFELADLVSDLEGTIRLTGNYFYLKRDQQTVAGADLDEFHGEQNNAKHTYSVNGVYSNGDFMTMLQWRHSGSFIPSNEFADDRRDVQLVPGWDVFNMTLGYQFTETIRGRFVVDNIFDDRGDSMVQQAYVSNGAYDPFGRRYSFAISTSF